METPPSNSPELWQHLAEVVAGQLRLRRISQRAAAESTGISFRTLSNRLTQRSPFTVPELQEISRLLGIPVQDVFIAAEGGKVHLEAVA